MKRLTPLLALALLTASPLAVRAGGAGGEPFNFLFLDAGGRAAGMGGACTAACADSNALLYNPAALGAVDRYEATFMHNEHFHNITQEYMGFASPQGFGANLNYVSWGRTPKTTISSPDGTLGHFGITDLALGLGYGREVVEGVHAGAAAKIIRESIENVSAQGYAMDLGALASPAALPGLRLGMAVQNLGPTVRFQHARENLPLNVRMGAAYSFAPMGRESTFSFDLNKERSESVLLAFGAEVVIARALAVRAGFNTRNQAGPGVTMGFGWIHKSFGVDYAMVPYGDLGYTHKLSATVRWGARGGTKTQAKAAKPDAAQSGLQKAEEFLDMGMFEEARRELASAMGRVEAGDRRLVEYHELMGRIQLAQKNFELARQSYYEAITTAIRLGLVDKVAAEAYAGMGRCLLEQKNRPYAVRFLKKSLEIGPSAETQKSVNELLLKLSSE